MSLDSVYNQCQQLLHSNGVAPYILRELLQSRLRRQLHHDLQKLVAAYKHNNQSPHNIHFRDFNSFSYGLGLGPCKVNYFANYFKKKELKSMFEGEVTSLDIPLLVKVLRNEYLCGRIVTIDTWDQIYYDGDALISNITTPSENDAKETAKMATVLLFYRNIFTHKPQPSFKDLAKLKDIRGLIEDAVLRLARIVGISREELCKVDTEVGGNTVMRMEIQEIYQYVRDSPKQACNVVEALPGKDLSLDLQSDDLMPMVFTAKKLKLTSLHMANQSPTQDKYKDVDYKNDFDKVIEELGNGKRVVLCEGDAGMGKTISFKRIVSSYYNSESDFNKFKNVRQFNLVFYIPVRHIDTKAKLIDVICCKKNGMGYTKPYMRETVKQILQDSEMGSKVLILLDGVDERKIPEGEDLYKLMTGEIYPHVKLMINTRPEAKILTKLRNFDPDLKIQLKGTSDDGIKEYLRTALNKVLNKDINVIKEVENMLRRCKENMVDFTILHVPLYLTLIQYIFEEYLKSNFSLSTFDVPNSMTELFNAFLLLLVRKWLERLLGDDASGLTFNKSPLDSSSTIPADIKRILLCFAEMSSNCLLTEVYNFSDTDLHNYLVTPEELKMSGFFAVSDGDGRSYFTHKQFQEYFAAIHIAHRGYNTESFRERIDKAKNMKDKKCLRDIFENLEMAMKFVFGMNPEFCVRLLKEVKEHTSIRQDTLCKDRIDGPQIHYELRLCAESYSPEVHQAMAELLLSAEVKQKVQDLYDYLTVLYDYRHPYRPCEVRSMIKIIDYFDHNEHILLIKKWYDIPIELNNKTKYEAVIKSDNPTKLNVYNFSCIQFILMAPFVFPDVRELSFEHSEISDVSLLYRISFPGLQSVEIGRPSLISAIDLIENVIEEKLMKLYCQNSSDGSLLTNVSVNVPVSACAMKSLLNLKNLQVLKIMSIESFRPHYTQMIINSIVFILSKNLALKDIYIMHTKSLSYTVSEPLKLLAKAIEKLEYLKRIYLINIFDCDIDILFDSVRQWKNVESLGLSLNTVARCGDKVAEVLSMCPNIKKFTFCFNDPRIQSQIPIVCKKIHRLSPDTKLYTAKFDSEDDLEELKPPFYTTSRHITPNPSLGLIPVIKLKLTICKY